MSSDICATGLHDLYSCHHYSKHIGHASTRLLLVVFFLYRAVFRLFYSRLNTPGQNTSIPDSEFLLLYCTVA